MDLGGRSQRSSATCITSCQGACCGHDGSLLIVTSVTWGSVCPGSLPESPPSCLQESPCTARADGVGAQRHLSRQFIYIRYLESLFVGDLTFLAQFTHLFNHLFMSVRADKHPHCALGYNAILGDLFCCSAWSSSRPWSPSVGPSVLHALPCWGARCCRSS